MDKVMSGATVNLVLDNKAPTGQIRKSVNLEGISPKTTVNSIRG